MEETRDSLSNLENGPLKTRASSHLNESEDGPLNRRTVYRFTAWAGFALVLGSFLADNPERWAVYGLVLWIFGKIARELVEISLRLGPIAENEDAREALVSLAEPDDLHVLVSEAERELERRVRLVEVAAEAANNGDRDVQEAALEELLRTAPPPPGDFLDRLDGNGPRPIASPPR